MKLIEHMKILNQPMNQSNILFSKHLTYEKANCSNTNRPNVRQKKALQILGTGFYDRLYEEFGDRVLILDCFRSKHLCQQLGRKIGPHTEGTAMDITSIDDNLPNNELFEYIYHNYPYDCIVWSGAFEEGWCTNESPLWIHISLKKLHNRKIAYREHLSSGTKIIKQIYR
ncbi:MAG: hypothetical protein M0P99_00210 [Candidatus Cloacimonetes bacterium]|nr:hypothetical protein [Candidatus Cloacimonadota bacterium]